MTIAEQVKQGWKSTGDPDKDEAIAHEGIEAWCGDSLDKILAEIPADYKNNPSLTGESITLKQYAYYYLWEQLFPEEV